ncbi:NAD(P)H-hydrate epimerase [Treponema sp. OMZ 840]|uniref:NAD(P)H-hydrate epimerase n=1 Tax=Treponema sp. OMZ 840 TaxID=244313 RepID=UPI003D8A6A6E
MQNIYTDTRALDRAAVSRFGLTEDILMENAARALENEVVRACTDRTADIRVNCSPVSECRVLIAAGGGDNGGDGWALARRLNGGTIEDFSCSVAVLEVFPPKSQACMRQAERARSAGVPVIRNFSRTDFIKNYHVIVDCIFGSGFHGSLSAQIEKLIAALNKADCFKIACDIPSGIDSKGVGTSAFRADVTVCMGALKTALFSDFAKNHTGKIITAPLGVSSALFQNGAEPAALLLEGGDLHLPERTQMSVHKGDFGHAAVYAGDKAGAGVIASCAAFRCGAGLVSLIHPEGRPLQGLCCENNQKQEKNREQEGCREQDGFPFYIMQTENLPEKANLIVAGPGFGRNDVKRAEKVFSVLEANPELNGVLDADIFYYEGIKKLLERRPAGRPTGLVLTPHPKEFQSLLALCGFGTLSVQEIAEKRLELVSAFCSKYPEVVLLLKGANAVIGLHRAEDVKPHLYINTLGMPCLAKGGSGDVLAGFIAGLLAQRYSPLDAAIQGSLLLAAVSRLQKSSYSSTPFTLIQSLEEPEKLKRVLEEWGKNIGIPLENTGQHKFR